MRVFKAALFLLAIPALVTCAFAQDVLQVDAQTIQQHIDHQVSPVYPPIAKAAHIQGAVVFNLRIGATGKIESMDVVSGPPMLRQAAIDSLKQWTFHPFEKDGVSVAAAGPASIIFALSDYHPAPDDEQVADRYFPLFDQCNKAISSRADTKSAEDVCNEAAKTAEKFGPEVRFIEKRSAFVYAAAACTDNRDLPNALAWAGKAVEVVKLGHDDNSGSSAAYTVKGEAEGLSGDLRDADQDLTAAEDFSRKAIEWARQSNFEHGNSYEHSFNQILQFHAKVLQAMGQPDEAQKKLDEAARFQ
ncbi:MAG: energy transducer TonB [Terracidiphilus sp.]|jgi:TonB family protein